MSWPMLMRAMHVSSFDFDMLRRERLRESLLRDLSGGADRNYCA
jgi:hypothetical protein